MPINSLINPDILYIFKQYIEEEQIFETNNPATKLLLVSENPGCNIIRQLFGVTCHDVGIHGKKPDVSDYDVILILHLSSDPSPGFVLYDTLKTASRGTKVLIIDVRDMLKAFEMGSVVYIDGPFMHRLANANGLGTLALDPLFAYYIYVGEVGGKNLINPRPLTLNDVSNVYRFLRDKGIYALPVGTSLTRGYAMWDPDFQVYESKYTCFDIGDILSKQFDFPIDVICGDVVVRTKWGIGWRKVYTRYAMPGERVVSKEQLDVERKYIERLLGVTQ
jgi:hypothetical protein